MTCGNARAVPHGEFRKWVWTAGGPKPRGIPHLPVRGSALAGHVVRRAAMVAGALGALAGGLVGALVGGIAGAIAGKVLKRQAA